MEAVQVSGDLGDLGGRETELRHLAAPVLNDGGDELAVLVVEDHIGPKEIRPAFTAASVGAMAKIALDAVDRFAAFDDGGIGRGTIRVRRGTRRPLAGSASSARARRRGGRGRRGLSGKTRRSREKNDNSQLHYSPRRKSISGARAVTRKDGSGAPRNDPGSFPSPRAVRSRASERPCADAGRRSRPAPRSARSRP